LQSPWRKAWHSTLETAFRAERGFVSGICLTHHLRHNRVLHERVLFIASVSVDAPRVEAANRIKLVPVGAGITRVHLDEMEQRLLRLAVNRLGHLVHCRTGS
jgi:K+ transporter